MIGHVYLDSSFWTIWKNTMAVKRGRGEGVATLTVNVR